MIAIEYNTWMSVMSYIGTQLPLVAGEFGLSGISVDIIPSYPRDLTKFRKPSIIVQKIHTSKNKMAFGNFIGQYLDDVGNQYDVSGIEHDMIYQINAVGDSNSQCSLLTD
jgi:hypothetical protein